MLSSKVIKAAIGLLLIANWKNLPLVYHIRFFRLMAIKFYLRPGKPPKSIFQTTDHWTYTTLLEIDFNFHKSNSTYFSDFDIARSANMMTMFRKFYREYKDPEVRMRKSEWPFTPLGSVNMVFLREIMPYQWYNIRTRVLGWTNKWVYLISRFERNGKVYAVGVAKYVFKMRRKTVPPEQILRFEGLLTEEALKQNASVQKYLNDALELEQLGDLFDLNLAE